MWLEQPRHDRVVDRGGKGRCCGLEYREWQRYRGAAELAAEVAATAFCGRLSGCIAVVGMAFVLPCPGLVVRRGTVVDASRRGRSPTALMLPRRQAGRQNQ
ncbi:MAG: hypothetical protein RJQ10_10655 [Haliea sp.]|uniref:hypothetical protein n=1 Tax=Haliea sp. TaxID=1932666 RepID=UPI0032ED964A